jgi:hypothetical protein
MQSKSASGDATAPASGVGVFLLTGKKMLKLTSEAVRSSIYCHCFMRWKRNKQIQFNNPEQNEWMFAKAHFVSKNHVAKKVRLRF